MFVLVFRLYISVEDIYDFSDFAFHCQYSYPNDTLKDYLQSLEIPFPKSVMTQYLPDLPDDRPTFDSLPIMLYCFRALSRKVGASLTPFISSNH
jgi:hypothetical protein